MYAQRKFTEEAQVRLRSDETITTSVGPRIGERERVVAIIYLRNSRERVCVKASEKGR